MGKPDDANKHELAVLRGELKRLQDAYKKLEEEKVRIGQECHTLFEGGLDVLLIIHGETGKIMKANRSAETVLGYQSKDLVGRNFSKLYADQKKNNAKSPAEDVKFYDNVISEKFLRVDGTYCTMDLTVTMIPWKKDSAFLVALRDVTHRVQVEEERDQLVLKLQEAMEKVVGLRYEKIIQQLIDREHELKAAGR